jgi:transglutaminase-like putative cysteine protease
MNPQPPTRYAITHLTRFRYEGRASESVMEVRMRPATNEQQRCLHFTIDVQPRARVFDYRDHYGNHVHHFDIPRRHAELSITTRSQVEMEIAPPAPAALTIDAWHEVDEWARGGAHWEFRQPSHFAEWTPALLTFAASTEAAGRKQDPLSTTTAVMAALHTQFEYAPNTTRVDSPIDEALAARRGVCQDFSHVMIAVLRRLGLPSRYVSGYLAPVSVQDSENAPIATHAWLEACLPGLGWLGFDPTHNVAAGVRHVRVATGRDYADVPPTRGVFKGGAASSLTVAVEVTAGEAAPAIDSKARSATVWPAPPTDFERERAMQQQ